MFRQENYFDLQALYEIFSWNPQPWSLPVDSELTKLGALLCQPDEMDERTPIMDDGTPYLPHIDAHMKTANQRWFFSVASIAIDFSKYFALYIPCADPIYTTFLFHSLINLCSAMSTQRTKIELAHTCTQRELSSCVSSRMPCTRPNTVLCRKSTSPDRKAYRPIHQSSPGRL